jgi:hypothetical protein
MARGSRIEKVNKKYIFPKKIFVSKIFLPRMKKMVDLPLLTQKLWRTLICTERGKRNNAYHSLPPYHHDHDQDVSLSLPSYCRTLPTLLDKVKVGRTFVVAPLNLDAPDPFYAVFLEIVDGKAATEMRDEFHKVYSKKKMNPDFRYEQFLKIS